MYFPARGIALVKPHTNMHADRGYVLTEYLFLHDSNGSCRYKNKAHNKYNDGKVATNRSGLFLFDWTWKIFILVSN